jgi:uncharacterized Ntn-hydrolase superfamily protein
MLELLREDVPVADGLARLLAADEERETRQVGVVDAQGNSATHTGSHCVRWASHAAGDGVSCQANMMANSTVPQAMLQAFSSAAGDLTDRLFAALLAAEAEGGDYRGRQSAALLVAPGPDSPRIAVPPDSDLEPWQRRIDLRVDDAAAPLDELGRLLRLMRAQEAFGLAHTREVEGDLEGAVAAYRRAADLAPDDDQIVFLVGRRLLKAGQDAEARVLLRRALEANPVWTEHVRRLIEAGLTESDSLSALAQWVPDAKGPGSE